MSPIAARLWLLVLSLPFVVAGCASIRSASVAEMAQEPHGLVYYMPTQFLVLTLTVSDTKTTQGKNTTTTSARAVALTQTPALADTTRRFVLEFRRNHVGTAKANIGIGSDGLLTGSLEGSSTGKIKETLEGLAGSSAWLRSDSVAVSAANNPLAPPNLCAAPGTYVWVLDANGGQKQAPHSKGKALTLADCRLQFLPNTLFAGSAPASQSPAESGPGIYYRQALPLLVVVQDDLANTAYSATPVIVGPHSPVHFLPIPRTLLSTVGWKLTFANGVPTKYDIDASSDILSLVTLPADVLAAYSKALTAGLTARKGDADAEVNYLKAMALLEAQRKEEACRQARASGDPSRISAACP